MRWTVRPLAWTFLLVTVPVAAAQPIEPIDYLADARSIEALVNDNYAYLERLPGQRFALTATLRVEAAQVATKPALTRFAERALTLLADHHAITGASRKDSWAVFPSYGDLWIDRHGATFAISAVRAGSPAELAGIHPGDALAAVEGQPIAAAITNFWSDLGTTGGGERDGYAARVLAAGRRDRPRRLSITNPKGNSRTLTLPNLYVIAHTDRPPVSVTNVGHDTVIRFNDSLGDSATIAAFDMAMQEVPPRQRLVLDLRDTPSGGNTSVARAILGWFVRRPAFYQVHNLPAEERQTGIARQWVEQVLPRPGKFRAGPMVVRVGRWTGSMGEGLAIGFDALGKLVEGEPMAGLLGAVDDYRLEQSGLVIKLPTERLSAVDGTPREKFVPGAVTSTR